MSIEDFEDFDDLEESEDGPMALTFVGYDDCILGMCERAGDYPRVAYSYNRIIAKVMTKKDLTREDAEEFFEYHIAGLWLGDGTPWIVFEKQKSH